MTEDNQYYYGTYCSLRPKWVLDKLNGATGKNVNIAVIDSGCDTVLWNDYRIEQGVSFVKEGTNFDFEKNSNYGDKIGHGTICIDRIFQIASYVKIIPIKVFDNILETSPNILTKAINYAIEKKVDIINLSLSTKLDEALNPLYLLCEKAKELGIIIVASNANSEIISYPAIFDNVISVSSKELPNIYDYLYFDDEYSECCANGLAVDALTLNSKRIKSGGNSFAAPVISAIISLLIERYKTKDIQSVRELLRNFALNKTV